MLVEGANRDQLRPVRETGDELPVVGLLRDRRRHVRPVSVLVQRHLVVVRIVASGRELAALEVRAAAKLAAAIAVRDAGVDDRDPDSARARSSGVHQVLPRAGRVDAPEGPERLARVLAAGRPAGEEVPLQRLPASGRRRALPAVVGDPLLSGGVRDVVGDRPPHPRVVLQGPGRPSHPDPVRKRVLALRWSSTEADQQLAGGRPTRSEAKPSEGPEKKARQG